MADCFSWEELSTSQIVLITNNLKIARKMLSAPERRQTFEDIINANGLEHFIDVWACNREGTIKKFST